MLAFLLAPFYLLFNLYLFRRIMGWVRAWFPWFRKRKHLSRKYRGVGRTVNGNRCHGHARGHLHHGKQ